jgi:hypothetical protein
METRTSAEIEENILIALGEDIIPLYYVVKINYFVGTLAHTHKVVNDLVKPSVAPLLQALWSNARAEDKYLAIQAYQTFLDALEEEYQDED